MDFICFLWISWDFIDFRGRIFRGVWQPVGTRSCPYRNLCSILAGCYLIDFHGFSWFSWISWDFMDFDGRGLETCYPLWGRGPAPIETFARSQLAAIIDSSIHQIWRWLAAISLIFFDFLCFLWISWDFIDFMNFIAFQGSDLGNV